MEDSVSIVVPVYNVEKYLGRCIQSIVNQTYQNLEIILVDDGSTDRSGAICDSWAEKDCRVKSVRKKNAGAGFARNTGLEAATGRYVLFVDSDDYIHPLTVQKCVAELQKSNSDVVMFGRFNVSSNGKVEEKPIVTDCFYFEGERVISDILPGLFIYERGSGISTCCKMFKLETINNNNIRFKSERELLSEDAFFNLELFAHIKSVSIIPESFYYYFKNEGSLSRSYREELSDLNNSFLNKSLALCKSAGYPERVADYIIARYHIYALGGMKQIMRSDLSQKQKRNKLKAVLKDEVMHSTLVCDALRLETVPLRCFYLALKYKQYWLCYLFLTLKH